MLEESQLNAILKALENSIENRENYLYKSRECLSIDEKKKIIEEIQEYKNASVEVEYIIGNKTIENIMN